MTDEPGADPTAVEKAGPTARGRHNGAGGDTGAPSGRGADAPKLAGESELAANRVTRLAYEDGRELLNPIKIEASRDAHIHIDKRVFSASRGTSAAPGRVPLDEIEHLQARYVKVPGHEEMRRALRSRRLLILVGTPGSGRSATGLSLLDELTDGAVARLDPGARPFLPDGGRTETANGYLACVDAGVLPPRAAADRFAADLATADAYCVLTARPSPELRRELDFYCVGHDQADTSAMLAQHVQAGVLPEDDDDFAVRMADLAPAIAGLLGPAARPADAAQSAALLLAHGRGELGRNAVDALVTRLVLDDRIEEWFSVLVGVTHGQRADRARRLTALRIAVAVFDGLPRHVAERAAEPLALRMAIAPEPPEMPRVHKATGSPASVATAALPRSGPRGIDPEEAATLLLTTPIDVRRGGVPFFSRTVPGETISYRDDRLPSAVLRCVWQNHYPLREPVMGWLDDLSRDDQQAVRFRAAQAAGLLCALDYSHTLDALVVPAAQARPRRDPAVAHTVEPEEEDERIADLGRICRRRRQFAAMAMDHVARDAQLGRVVRFTLRRWRRNPDPALRWTAARAYGYDIGASYPLAALEELKVLGTPWERHPYPSMTPTQQRLEESVFHAAGDAVADMFGSGAHREVLAALDEWSGDERWSVRLLALQAIVALIPRIASSVGTPDTGGGARVEPNRAPQRALLDERDRVERARWPIFVALHGREPELQRQGAELIRFALRSREQPTVLAAFEEIYFVADDFPDALPAVEAFLPLLIKDESDRDRLLGLLHRMRGAWADPLSAEVADRLAEVIVGAPVMTGKKVFS